jgi:hypothetical protein
MLLDDEDAAPVAAARAARRFRSFGELSLAAIVFQCHGKSSACV